MEITVKGFGGFIAIGAVALSGYVLYLKGKSDAAHEIRRDLLKILNEEHHNTNTKNT